MRATVKNYREIFNTREGYNLDTVVGYLVAKTGKEVKLEDLAKKVYKKGGKQNRAKIKMVVKGVNRNITRDKLGYKLVTFTGAGEEATLVLAPKK